MSQLQEKSRASSRSDPAPRALFFFNVFAVTNVRSSISLEDSRSAVAAKHLNGA